MSENERLSEFLKELFEDKPLLMIAKFLECFDDNGRQTYNVPRIVLESLAAKLLEFMRGDFNSIDKAFGGQVARQRQALQRKNIEFDIAFDYLCALDEAQEIDKSDRSGTPSELAIEKVAYIHDMGTENVRRILKNSKKVR